MYRLMYCQIIEFMGILQFNYLKSSIIHLNVFFLNIE